MHGHAWPQPLAATNHVFALPLQIYVVAQPGKEFEVVISRKIGTGAVQLVRSRGLCWVMHCMP